MYGSTRQGAGWADVTREWSYAVAVVVAAVVVAAATKKVVAELVTLLVVEELLHEGLLPMD